jgi:hypothetical protein
MYITTNENGVLNNYPVEPEMYCAEYPSVEQQRQYVWQGGFAALLVVALVLVGFGVS